MAGNPEIGRSIRANGIETNYHDQGEGQPIILIHGSGAGVSAWANWRLALPYLAKGYRVLAPDIVGFGFTERPAGVRYDMDTWVPHLIGFLDALGLEKVGLVGNSFGGALSLHLATRHPDRFTRLVLMGAAGTHFELTPGLDFAWGFTPTIENMMKLMDYFTFDKSLISRELAELRLKAAQAPGVMEAFSAMFPAPRQRSIDALAVPDEKLRALPHETLVIHGREDAILPVTASMHIAAQIPRSQLHVFGRCGHWTQIEHAGRFHKLVEDFFAEGA